MTDNALPQPAATPALKGATAANLRRFRIGIASGLVLAFGGLVFVAVATVLAISIWSARENTLSLLQDKTQSTMRLILGNIDRHLQPAEDQLEYLAKKIETGEIDAGDDAEMTIFLTGALAATPDVRTLVLLRTDFTTVQVPVAPAARHDRPDNPAGLELATAILADAERRQGLYWAEVVRPPGERTTMINVRRPVRRNGEFLGLLAAGVEADHLSDLLDNDAYKLGGSAFILYDDEFVLAHPQMILGFPGLSPAQPLPRVDQIVDPVLAAYLRPGDIAGLNIEGRLSGSMNVRFLDTSEGEFVALFQKIDGYSDRPWTVVVYFPEAELTETIRRAAAAAIAGLAVLLVALIVAFVIARQLSAPIGRLAVSANQIKDLRLDGVKPLPASSFAELSDASSAFNSMIVGLRWFETYVPRTLVQRLIGQGDAAAGISADRSVTVLFTDIAGFTGQSEHMTAAETATFLNQHFSLLSQCVEAEGGTIDKFIGDALMAFWGAPEQQPDHAARACRAALSIRAAVKADNAARIATGKPPVRVRIGLHSGHAVVGNIGAPQRMNYTIVGDTVNVANRLEALAKTETPQDADDEVTILLSAATAEAAGTAIAPVKTGSFQIRGRSEAIDVFAL